MIYPGLLETTNWAPIKTNAAILVCSAFSLTGLPELALTGRDQKEPGDDTYYYYGKFQGLEVKSNLLVWASGGGGYPIAVRMGRGCHASGNGTCACRNHTGEASDHWRTGHWNKSTDLVGWRRKWSIAAGKNRRGSTNDPAECAARIADEFVVQLQPGIRRTDLFTRAIWLQNLTRTLIRPPPITIFMCLYRMNLLKERGRRSITLMWWISPTRRMRWCGNQSIFQDR